MNSLKKKDISEEKFVKLYREQLSELNPKNVFEHLNLITGNFEPILMCHCAKTKFCHRHLAAEWLEKEMKINIMEYNVTDTDRKEGYLTRKKTPSLFNQEE